MNQHSNSQGAGGSAISFLPFMPFDPAWIEQSAAFVHADDRLGKAVLRLLFAAWRGMPAGSIPSSHAFVASATGLSQEVVAEHYVLLTEGFELRVDGRLYHVALANVCDSMTKAYGREIESFALATAMAAQDPEMFGVMNVEASSKRGPKGVVTIPRGFGYDMCPTLREWAAGNGYPTPYAQDWIMTKFIDFSLSRGDRQKDWAAAYRTYARNEITMFRRNPPLQPPDSEGLFPEVGPAQSRPRPGGGFDGLQRGSLSRGDRATAHNKSLLDRVGARAAPGRAG